MNDVKVCARVCFLSLHMSVSKQLIIEAKLSSGRSTDDKREETRDQ